jgi:hypothetical protein
LMTMTAVEATQNSACAEAVTYTAFKNPGAS